MATPAPEGGIGEVVLLGEGEQGEAAGAMLAEEGLDLAPAQARPYVLPQRRVPPKRPTRRPRRSEPWTTPRARPGRNIASPSLKPSCNPWERSRPDVPKCAMSRTDFVCIAEICEDKIRIQRRIDARWTPMRAAKSLAERPD